MLNQIRSFFERLTGRSSFRMSSCEMMNKDISRLKKKLSKQKIGELTSDLSSLLQAKINLSESLTLELIKAFLRSEFELIKADESQLHDPIFVQREKCKLDRLLKLYSTNQSREQFAEVIAKAVKPLLKRLPLAHIEKMEKSSALVFQVPLNELIENEVLCVQEVCELILENEVIQEYIPTNRSFIERQFATQKTSTNRSISKDGWHDSKLLARTGIGLFLRHKVKVGPTKDECAEHMFLTASTGHGKTRLLSLLQKKQLIQEVVSKNDKTGNGKASIVIVDSQRDHIDEFSHLKCFSPYIQGSMADCLAVVEPRYLKDHPINMNPFNMGNLSGMDPVHQEFIKNVFEDMMMGILDEIMGASMTSGMKTVLANIAEANQAMPNPSLDSLSEILRADEATLAPILPKLSKHCQMFFHNEYFEKGIARTKTAIQSRISSLQRQSTLRTLFSDAGGELDLFDLLNKGSVILLSSDKGHLMEENSRLLSKVYLMKVLQACYQRAQLPIKDRIPVYLYIDECQDIVVNNPRVHSYMQQGRKYGFTTILATQSLSSLDSQTRSIIFQNTSVKLIGRCDDEVNDIAGRIGCKVDKVKGLKKIDFSHSEWMLKTRSLPNPVKVKVPLEGFSKIKKMSDKEFEGFLKYQDQRLGKRINKKKVPQKEAIKQTTVPVKKRRQLRFK